MRGAARSPEMWKEGEKDREKSGKAVESVFEKGKGGDGDRQGL